MVGIGFTAIAYGISRTAHYIVAAILIVLVTITVIIGIFINNPMDTSALSYMIVGIFIGSMFFSFRGTMLITLLDLIALLFLPSLSD